VIQGGIVEAITGYWEIT